LRLGWSCKGSSTEREFSPLPPRSGDGSSSWANVLSARSWESSGARPTARPSSGEASSGLDGREATERRKGRFSSPLDQVYSGSSASQASFCGSEKEPALPFQFPETYAGFCNSIHSCIKMTERPIYRGGVKWRSTVPIRRDIQDRGYQLPRKSIPGTSVNKGLSPFCGIH
jgi:hypothetical protein